MTDGMVANRIQVRELRESLQRLREFDGEPLDHRDYNREVIGKGPGRLDRQVYRALRGLAVELRVLRLKRIAGLGGPEAYKAELDRQAEQLLDELELIREVLTLAGGLDASKEHERRRLELPPRRRRRQRREQKRFEEHRENLARLFDTSRQLELVAAVPELGSSFGELYVNVSEEGEVTAMMSPRMRQKIDALPRRG